MATNPTIPEPRAPGPWVTATSCTCGAVYDAHRGAYDFKSAADRVRNAAKRDGDDGGGFRSRGPVLWALRVMKLESWYMEHCMCGHVYGSGESAAA